MRSLHINRPHTDDPLYSQKNPHQTFLLLLSIISSWPLLQGHANSALLERELTDSTIIVWGVCLLGGSVIALIGEFWRGHTWNALNIERCGLGVVAAAALLYSMVVWTAAGTQAGVAFVAGVTSAYGLSCVWRCGQITRRLRWINDFTRELTQIRADKAARDEEDGSLG